MAKPRTATPLLTTTLVIAAATAAILVGCTRHDGPRLTVAQPNAAHQPTPASASAS